VRRELDVEHYRPKVCVTEWSGKPAVVSDTPPREVDVGAGYWWLAFAWDNYSLACKGCNQGWKRNLFPIEAPRCACIEGVEVSERPLLVEPASAFRTRDHFRWDDAGHVLPESDVGYATIVTCGLNRRELTSPRLKAAIRTNRVLDRLIRSLRRHDATEVHQMADELAELGSRFAEFTSMVRWIAENRLGRRWEEIEGMPA
jgi:hypothetical protein